MTMISAWSLYRCTKVIAIYEGFNTHSKLYVRRPGNRRPIKWMS